MMRGTIQLVSTRGETIRYIVFECIAIQGRRKQFFSGQANQPNSYMYREFTVMGVINASYCVNLEACPPDSVIEHK